MSVETLNYHQVAVTFGALFSAHDFVPNAGDVRINRLASRFNRISL